LVRRPVMRWSSDRRSDDCGPEVRAPIVRIALTRPVPPSINQCELTHLAREPVDFERAAAQHADYEALLEELGCVVRRLPLLAELPDSVFVEDDAIVTNTIAVITRPGALSRRPETADVAEMLRAY